MSCTIEDLRKEFERQADFPQGGDCYIGAFNLAMANILKDPEADVSKILLGTVCQRADLTEPHRVIVTHRVVQSLILGGADGYNYPEGFEDPSRWEAIIDPLLKDCRFSAERDLNSKEVTTTIFQRYAGLRFALSWFKQKMGKKEIDILDEGCGGDHGLPGIKLNKEFQKIKDGTPHKILSRMLGEPIVFRKQDALDIRDPRDSAEMNWRRACSFYPSEIKEKRAEFIKFEEEIYTRDGSFFYKADMKDTKLPEKSYDVISMMTALYQMKPDEVGEVLAEAKRILKPGGIIVIQDIADVSPNGTELQFISNGFGVPFAYRTFIMGDCTDGKFWEVMRWKNGRCGEAIPGKDFDKLFLNEERKEST